jgi:hypothetical protein
VRSIHTEEITMSAARLLVVANRTGPCPGLIAEVARSCAAEGGEVLVVAPALNTRLRHWVSDTDDALSGARERLDQAVDALTASGLRASGEIGDADPMLAIEDALHAFEADAIVLSTHPPGDSNWLARDLPARTRERFGLPVTHVVSRYGVEETLAA